MPNQNEVNVTISANDATSAALSSVQSKLQMFKQQSDSALGGLDFNARQGRASVALLGEEIGVRVPRMLRSVLAESQILGPVLAGAFSGIAALAFLEVALKIPDAIAKGTDALFGFGDAQKKAYADAVKFNEVEIKHLEKMRELAEAGALIGLSGSAAARKKFGFGQDKADRAWTEYQTAQRELARLTTLSQETEFISGSTGFEAPTPVPTDAAERARADLGAQALKVKALKNLYDDATSAAKNLGKSTSVAFGDEARAAIEKATAATKAFWDGLQGGQQFLAAHSTNTWDKFSAPYEKMVDSLLALQPPTVAEALKAQELIDKIYALRDAYVVTAATEDKLNDEHMKHMAQQLKMFSELQATVTLRPDFDSWTYVQAPAKASRAFQTMDGIIKDSLANVDQYFAAGGAGIRSWGNMVVGTLQRVVSQLLYTRIVSGLLSSIFGGVTSMGGAWGGGSLPPGFDYGSMGNGFSGIGGWDGKFAAGGYIQPGHFGLVGETGPEVAYGGKSGMTITPPATAPSRGGDTYYVDVKPGVSRQEMYSAILAAHQAAKGAAKVEIREAQLRGSW